MANHDANMHTFCSGGADQSVAATPMPMALIYIGKLQNSHEERYKKRQVFSSIVYGFCFPMLLLLLVSVLLTQPLSQLPLVFVFTAILFVLSCIHSPD